MFLVSIIDWRKVAVMARSVLDCLMLGCRERLTVPVRKATVSGSVYRAVASATIRAALAMSCR